jgi:hypothetical protein
MGSFAVEKFGTERTQKLTREADRCALRAIPRAQPPD